MSDSTRRFSSRVEYYVRSRPRYPAALLDFFRERFSLNPTHYVADIGSGTGLLTELFLQNGNPTFAVEPNAQMRSAAETSLSAYANFHSVDGTAEATTLPELAFDLVTAGQAFHWFDPIKSRAEFQRILKPGGWVALIWNERKNDASPFNCDYDALIHQYEGERIDNRRAGMQSGETPALTTFFAEQQFKFESFENPQKLDEEGLVDRLASASYMPLPSDPRYASLRTEIRHLFQRHEHHGKVTIWQETRVFYGQL